MDFQLLAHQRYRLVPRGPAFPDADHADCVIVAWIVNFVRGAIGPGTVLGDLLTRGGNYLLGLPNQDTLAFWLGIGIALAGIWLLGLIIKTRAKHILQDYLDRLLTRVPLIRSIYSPVSRVVRLATDRGTGAPGDLSSMSVVSCRFGGAATASTSSRCLRASMSTISPANAAGSFICRPRRSRCPAGLCSCPRLP